MFVFWQGTLDITLMYGHHHEKADREREGAWKGAREGAWKGAREGAREGAWKGAREGDREGAREGGRELGRELGREGGRELGRSVYIHIHSFHLVQQISHCHRWLVV